jgi:hypothetical protein
MICAIISINSHFGLPDVIFILTGRSPLPLLPKMPAHNRNENDALMAGKTVFEYGKGPAFGTIIRLWEKLLTTLKHGE